MSFLSTFDHTNPMTDQSPNESDRFQLVENLWSILWMGWIQNYAAMVVDLLTREYEKLTWDEIMRRS